MGRTRAVGQIGGLAACRNLSGEAFAHCRWQVKSRRRGSRRANTMRSTCCSASLQQDESEVRAKGVRGDFSTRCKSASRFSAESSASSTASSARIQPSAHRSGPPRSDKACPGERLHGGASISGSAARREQLLQVRIDELLINLQRAGHGARGLLPVSPGARQSTAGCRRTLRNRFARRWKSRCRW